ncbi:MAG TPA: RluA family pseudouridine synthase [Vicinamibacterales bacterium]|nr:RluA family pseudouridine synthase [Vicinamibacterales bacterium]
MTSEVISRLHAVASAQDAGQRLDHFLARQLPQLSRSQIQRLIREGRVQVDGARPKPSLVVWDGLAADVSVPEARPLDLQPEALPLSILHDDPSLVVIDKPAGMVVHPAAGHRTGTVVHALLHHVGGLSGVGGRERPGIVHRLDRGTSGVMVIAKDDATHRALAQQFHDRQIEKEYLALVWGRMTAGTTIDRPIGRHPRQRQKMSTRSRRGRAALSSIIDAEFLAGLTLVRVGIATGRTHQIRVHLADAGHPVAGDPLYGGVRRRLPARLAGVARLERPFLHAARLTFLHPGTARRMAFAAPLPADLAGVLATLRRSSA